MYKKSLRNPFSGISSHDLQNNNKPPHIRPRKPPRLIHYAQGGTLTRNNFTLGKIPDFLSNHNSLFSAVDSGGAGGARAPAEFGGSEKGQSLISVSEFSYYYEHPRI